MANRKPNPTRAQQDIFSVSTILANARDTQLELTSSPDLTRTDRGLAATVLGFIIAALELTKEVNREDNNGRKDGPRT